MKPGSIVFLVLGFVLAVFILQNNQVITYRFFFWRVSLSQIILLPLTVLIGFAIGFVTGKARKK